MKASSMHSSSTLDVGDIFVLHFAGLLWKGFETYSQISIRNMLLVAGDWVRTKLFGRDISRM